MPSTAADYRSRRADVFPFRAVLPGPRGRPQVLAQELARPGDGGQLIAGIEKLATKALLCLLTRRGSRAYAPAEGTAFLTDAAKGVWRTPADVADSFYSARLDVSRQCRASEAATDPADERWGGLDLVGVTLAGDRVSVRLLLTSAAGSTYEFMTPISVPIR